MIWNAGETRYRYMDTSEWDSIARPCGWRSNASPVPRIWTNASILLNGRVGIHFSEIWIETKTFSLKKNAFENITCQNHGHLILASMRWLDVNGNTRSHACHSSNSVLLSDSHEDYNDVTLSAMASQITDTSTACLTVCSGAHQRKHQSSASLAFVMGESSGHRWIPLKKGQ